MGKKWKKILKTSFTLKMSISRWNFSFQHRRSELQPDIWRLHKILRHSFSSRIKLRTKTFSKTRPTLEMKFDFGIEIFKVKGVCGNFLTIFYVFSASNYRWKPSKNLAYIRNKILPWIGDFQGQGCLRQFFYYFFHIQRVKLHKNTLSNIHDKWDKYFSLHFTLHSWLVDMSISSQVGDFFTDQNEGNQ